SGDGHGAAFLYRRDAQTGTWSEQSRLAAYNSVRGDRFGHTVAVDGADIWIGAPAPRGDATGAIFVFRYDPALPVLDAPRRVNLADTDASDLFGDAIAVRNGIAAVTASGMDHQAGSVHLYERSGEEWRTGAVLKSAADALAPLAGEERRCTDGKVGPFDCKDVELLAFVPISMLSADG